MLTDTFTVSFGLKTTKTLADGILLLEKMAIKERMDALYEECLFHRVTVRITPEGDLRYCKEKLDIGSSLRACLCVCPALMAELELYRNDRLRIIGKLGKRLLELGAGGLRGTKVEKRNDSDIHYITIKDLRMTLEDASSFISELKLKDRLSLLEHFTVRRQRQVIVDGKANMQDVEIETGEDVKMLVVLDPSLIMHLDMPSPNPYFFICRVYNRYNTMLAKFEDDKAIIKYPPGLNATSLGPNKNNMKGKCTGDPLGMKCVNGNNMNAYMGWNRNMGR